MVTEFIKRIPLITPKTTSKPEKLYDMVAQRNPKFYNGKFDPLELKE